MYRKIFIFALIFIISPSLFSQSKEKVLVFEMHDEIAPPLWHKMQKAFNTAKDQDVALIILDINTYGGLLESADSMRTRILNSKIPVYAFINNNAASAGALISIACDSIYMVPGASMGAATVVQQTGEAAPDKYQSYMRAMMRATAEAKGRNPHIAEAMVDPAVYIAGLIDSTKVLTFTSSEAVKYGFCEAEVENIHEVVVKADIDNPQIITPKYSWMDYLIGFLVNPVVSSILIMIIIGGIYFELQTPGVGFPLVAAITAAVFYFAPLYLEGLASNWEIALFIVGIILLLIEIFAIPGFGIVGITGIICIVTGLTLSMVDVINFPNLGGLLSAILRSFGLVVFSATIGLFGSVFLAKKLLGDTKAFSRLALQATQESNQGYTVAAEEYISMKDKKGMAFTDLRPSGKVEIHGQIYDAQAVTGYIQKGDSVKVVHYEVGTLQVIKLEEKIMNINQRIEVVKGDITKLKTDAIVNAANNRLGGGSGIDGAIHRAAGKELSEACATLNGCRTGEAKMTAGFKLPATYIIHTVAPIWHGGLKGEPELLEQCYINCLKITDENRFSTIAFPNLGTGIYMYPKDKAAEIAVNTVSEWLKKHSFPEKVIFCCFEEDNYEIYKEMLS